jgi:hypothetical protein
MRRSNPPFVLRPRLLPSPTHSAVREAPASWLPEIFGILWLILLAVAIWMHSHVTKQTPIFDAFTYYQKADNFWTAVHAGKWFNPLNIEPTFRPPGTILMSYPLGFTINPRAFYFRSVYLPVFLSFVAVIVLVYEISGNVKSRWRIILTAVLFTSVTLPYHFEYGSAGGFWGLVDGFLAGLAALAAACVWRGTRPRSHILVWSVAACVVSIIAIVVKPSGAFIAAVVGVGWVALGFATVIDSLRSSDRDAQCLRKLSFKLLLGAVIIAIGDAAIVIASLKSGYLSAQSMSYGKGAIALMRQEPFPSNSLLWIYLNISIGRGLIYCTGLALLMCLSVLISHRRSTIALRDLLGIFLCIATLLFGMWFWFVGSAAPSQPRYAVPFFMMAAVWLVPATLRAWELAPRILRLGTAGVMFATVLNLASLLLVPQPAAAWQRFSGVGVTSSFSPTILSAFKRFVADSPDQPTSIYVFSLDTNDAILGSVIDESRLLYPKRQFPSLRRPVDWQRSSTIRINEVEAAATLMFSPQQCAWAPKGNAVATLRDEQAVFTCWADGLTMADGVTVYFSAPTVKMLSVVNSEKFSASLMAMVAAHHWDHDFVVANGLSPQTP